MKKYNITATVNGDELDYSCYADQTLLEVLRENLQMTGTKNGCGSGDCGACTVIVNKRPVNACLILGVELEGAIIETVEGLAEGL